MEGCPKMVEYVGTIRVSSSNMGVWFKLSGSRKTRKRFTMPFNGLFKVGDVRGKSKQRMERNAKKAERLVPLWMWWQPKAEFFTMDGNGLLEITDRVGAVGQGS
jgi:hypothetical protein